MYDDDDEFGEHPSTTDRVDKSDLTLTLPCFKSRGASSQEPDDD